ncbi:hypothetical protein CPB83DRAFT_841239 [Crepidotus variabilis]|uniref:Uncharacterized protein n=1 Tax=Crepidotus variabilis TaxID=179855 RepID=A0A9P6BCA0_9AGAR|nr:hypothetical protein CPB83DRAFT_841239 [Crepidotus variabilis]
MALLPLQKGRQLSLKNLQALVTMVKNPKRYQVNVLADPDAMVLKIKGKFDDRVFAETVAEALLSDVICKLTVGSFSKNKDRKGDYLFHQLTGLDNAGEIVDWESALARLSVPYRAFVLAIRVGNADDRMSHLGERLTINSFKTFGHGVRTDPDEITTAEYNSGAQTSRVIDHTGDDDDEVTCTGTNVRQTTPEDDSIVVLSSRLRQTGIPKNMPPGVNYLRARIPSYHIKCGTHIVRVFVSELVYPGDVASAQPGDVFVLLDPPTVFVQGSKRWTVWDWCKKAHPIESLRLLAFSPDGPVYVTKGERKKHRGTWIGSVETAVAEFRKKSRKYT